MSPIQRVQAVMSGQKPDRPPFSFWHHFSAEQAAGPQAVRAHLDLLEEYAVDFLKVMNDNGYPHHPSIQTIDDLASLGDLRGDEPEFARQLELIAELRKATAGRVLMTTTIFNSWAVLRSLVQPPRQHNPPDLNAAADAPSRWLRQAWVQSPQTVERALRIIGQNLSRFAGRCLQAGADGIFLSVRDDWLDVPGESPADLYDRLVRATDLHILSAVSRAGFNLLHVCGKAVNFRAFAEYPSIHAINWADRAAGPSIAQVKDWLKPAICAGVDNLRTLPEGLPRDVAHEVTDALSQAGGRPIMISPGCTFDPQRVSEQNLKALADAVRGGIN